MMRCDQLSLFAVSEQLNRLFVASLRQDALKAEYREESRKHFMSFALSVIGQALGSSVGSLVKPGTGTFIGGLLGAVLADQIPVDELDKMLVGGKQ